MIERVQAFTVLGKLDGMLYEIMQTRHEVSSAVMEISRPSLEDGKGRVIDVVV
ncbi:MAG: hypothetical protein N2314_05230 [Brevinematales bacterium]|nr:hypothetical protein [Brevinematales bacterium]